MFIDVSACERVDLAESPQTHLAEEACEQVGIYMKFCEACVSTWSSVYILSM